MYKVTISDGTVLKNALITFSFTLYNLTIIAAEILIIENLLKLPVILTQKKAL